jgi:Putative MetA-pathway of phenol degradation
MRAETQSGRHRAVALCALASLMSLGGIARADDVDSWHEIETKYIFGFTTGSGIGLEGEKEFTTDTKGRFGKRDGRYNATETKYEFEFTPSQLIQIEFGALGSTHDIAGVTDLDDRRQVAFAGGFAEFRYLAIERTSSNPLAVTLAVEPTVRVVDETSGERVHNYELETMVNADLELVRNRLYAGFNLLYEPEYTHTLTNESIREATFGGSAALSVRLAPGLLIGAEAWYLRHYDDFGASAFTGDALMVGPTLYVQFTPKMFMTAAWNSQVWGREVGNALPLNLAEFQRHRARLKFAWEF